MVDRINSLNIGPIPPSSQPASAGKKTGESSFQDVLRESIEKVNALQADKAEKIQALTTGKANSIEEVMIAVEEANLAFEFTMEVRNKLLEAYQEILRMQI